VQDETSAAVWVYKCEEDSRFLDPRFKHCSDDHTRQQQIEEQVKIEMMKVIEREDVDGVQCIEETSPPLLKKSIIYNYILWSSKDHDDDDVALTSLSEGSDVLLLDGKKSVAYGKVLPFYMAGKYLLTDKIKII